MQSRTLALVLAAAILGSGCVSKETKPDQPAAPVAAAAPEAAPVVSKPACPPEPSAKVKSKSTKKTSKTKKAEPVAVDCEPAKPSTAATATKASEPAAAPAAAASKETAKPSEPGQPRVVKSRDGTFDGEIYGNIPANSKWAKLQIGMHQSEVERILGVTSNIRGYVTAKAFIPFYYGTDSHRYEAVYAGQGSVAYTGGGMGGGQGVLMMINYDPKVQ
jgi:hypothetical protein